jgi:flavin reductase (DIM6/NTAB) family NADH-FMN oxidoreductase RutF
MPEAHRAEERMRAAAKVDRHKKLAWKPGNLLAPVPAVLVSCGGFGEWRANLITIAWTGSICSDPVMLSIAVRPERYSYEIIRKSREFAVNLPTGKQAKALDWCGMVSGRRFDKFAKTGLTPAPALGVKCPIVAECPINIECRVEKTLELGSHTLFLAEVAAVQVSAALVDPKGKLRLDKAGLLAFAHGEYFALGPSLGRFGFSVRKAGLGRRGGPRTGQTRTQNGQAT